MAGDKHIYRVAARMSGPNGQDIINVWHCQTDIYITGTDEECATEIEEEIAANYQLLEQSISVDQVSADMSTQNMTTEAVLGTSGWSPAFAGTDTGETAPPQTSLYSFFRTGFARRIGKKFWGIVAEAVQDNGLTVGSIATQMVAFLATWVGTWVGGTTGNTYNWGVYNENLSPTYHEFTEAVFEPRLRTQRRRRPGIGS